MGPLPTDLFGALNLVLVLLAGFSSRRQNHAQTGRGFFLLIAVDSKVDAATMEKIQDVLVNGKDSTRDT